MRKAIVPANGVTRGVILEAERAGRSQYSAGKSDRRTYASIVQSECDFQHDRMTKKILTLDPDTLVVSS